MERPSCPRCLKIQINKENKWGDHRCLCCGFQDLSPVFYEGPERKAVQELFMKGVLIGRGYHRKEQSIEEKKEERKEKERKNYQAHKEEKREYGINYYKTHRKSKKPYHQGYEEQNKQYCQICKDQIMQYGINYYITYKKKIQEYAKTFCRIERRRLVSRITTHKRNAALLSCQINDLTKEQIQNLLNNVFVCAVCSKKFTEKKRKKTIDHITPLSKGGNNTLLNIQVICKSCNSKKGNRDYSLYNNGQLLLFV